MTLSPTLRTLTERYVAQGHTIDVLANLFGASEAAMRARLRSWGLKPKARKPSRPKSYLADRDAQLCASFRKGKSLQMVADEFGVSRERVRQILNKNGISERRLWAVKNHPESLAEMLRLYEQGHSLQDIAEHIGVSTTIVSKNLHITPEVTEKRRISIFWRQVAVTADTTKCWLWTGPVHPAAGYGRYRWRGRMRTAYVTAFMITHDREPTKHVLHTCDDPLCCNPSHLYEGTPQDNVRDRERRRRSAHFRKNLVEYRRTPEEVDVIKELLREGCTQHAVADVAGCSVQLVNRIATGKVWANPTGIQAIYTPTLKQIYHDLVEGRRTCSSVAREFDIHVGTATAIKNGTHWRVKKFLAEDAPTG